MSETEEEKKKREDAEKRRQEALKPFKEKVELVDGFIEEIRTKLGDDVVTKVNDSLIGLRGTIVEADQLHETIVTENIETKDRNSALAQVNNDLYIKHAAAIKGQNVSNDPDPNDIDDDDALEAFTDEVVGTK